VFSPKLLRLCTDDLLPEQKLPPAQSIKIKGQNEWSVTDILDSKKPHGKLKYKVRWEGFGRNDIWYNTDGEKFANAKDLMDEFHY